MKSRFGGIFYGKILRLRFRFAQDDGLRSAIRDKAFFISLSILYYHITSDKSVSIFSQICFTAGKQAQE